MAEPTTDDGPHDPGTLTDDEVRLTGGLRLAVRRGEGPLRPFLLVHGLASNSRTWEGVARRLVAAGHAVVAVDQRGHGRSEVTAAGYDTDTCADDLADLMERLGWTGARAPVLAGQSWGGNVVLSLAARRDGVAAVCCVDGGWIRLGPRFATFDDCWRVLAPPPFEGRRYAEVARWLERAHPDWPPEGIAGTLANLEELPDGGVRARLDREHHRSILRSLYLGEPRAWYPLVDVPTLLCPAVPDPDAARAEVADDDAGAEIEARTDLTRTGVAEALAGLPDGRVSWYLGADHDIHCQHPARLAQDLLGLAAAVGPGAEAAA